MKQQSINTQYSVTQKHFR